MYYKTMIDLLLILLKCRDDSDARSEDEKVEEIDSLAAAIQYQVQYEWIQASGGFVICQQAFDKHEV